MFVVTHPNVLNSQPYFLILPLFKEDDELIELNCTVSDEWIMEAKLDTDSVNRIFQKMGDK